MSHLQTIQHFLRFNSRIRKPFMWLWLALVLLSMSGLYSFYHYQSLFIKQEAQLQLQSITQSKVEHVESWLAERHRDLSTFTQHKEILNKISLINQRANFRKDITSRADAFVKAYDYGRMSILGAQGQVLIDVGDLVNANIPEHTKKLIKQANATGKVASQLFWHEGIFHFDIVAKLMSLDGKNTHIGNIILHIDPTEFLAPFVNQWPLLT